MANPKSQNNFYLPRDNPIETFRDLGSNIVSSAFGAAKDSISSAASSIGLQGSSQEIGDSSSSEVFNSNENRKEVVFNPKPIYKEKRPEITLFSKESETQRKKIEYLLVELRKLSIATVELKRETDTAVIQGRIVNPGIYHLNFLDYLISIIRDARKNINDSRIWLMTFRSKKQKRQYWSMFKKHGSSFSLSGERTVATSTN